MCLAEKVVKSLTYYPFLYLIRETFRKVNYAFAFSLLVIFKSYFWRNILFLIPKRIIFLILKAGVSQFWLLDIYKKFFFYQLKIAVIQGMIIFFVRQHVLKE